MQSIQGLFAVLKSPGSKRIGRRGFYTLGGAFAKQTRIVAEWSVQILAQRQQAQPHSLMFKKRPRWPPDPWSLPPSSTS